MTACPSSATATDGFSGSGRAGSKSSHRSRPFAVTTASRLPPAAAFSTVQLIPTAEVGFAAPTGQVNARSSAIRNSPLPSSHGTTSAGLRYGWSAACSCSPVAKSQSRTRVLPGDAAASFDPSADTANGPVIGTVRTHSFFVKS